VVTTKSSGTKTSAWSVLPKTDKWAKAERMILAELRRSYKRLAPDHEDIADNALCEASRTWRGDAQFSTLAITIAIRDAKRRGRHLVKGSPLPVGPRPPKLTRTDLSPGMVARLGPVFEDFFRDETMIIGALMFEHAGEKLAAHLRRAIWGDGYGLLPHLFKKYDVKPPFSFALDEGFDARVTSFARKVLALDGEHWVESQETLDVPLPGVPGRRRTERHRPASRRVSRARRAALERQHRRLARFIFSQKREDAARAIIRFALSEAGFGGTLVNQALAQRRERERRETNRRKEEAIRILSRVISAGKVSKIPATNSPASKGHESQDPQGEGGAPSA